MFIDTHCHLEMKPLCLDVASVIERAKKAGVSKMITIGTDVASSKQAIAIAKRYPEVFPTVGAHPEFAAKMTLSHYQQLASLARDPSVVAIGEVGLDFYRLGKAGKFSHLATKEEQERLFEQMIGIAIENQLPLIIHSRQAAKETLDIVNSYRNELAGGVFHCFSYELELSRKFLDTGFFLSFTNIIGYKKNENLKNVVRFTPMEKILLETDAPFLPPENRRGFHSEPANVLTVAQVIADIKKLSLEQVGQITWLSSRGLFKI